MASRGPTRAPRRCSPRTQSGMRGSGQENQSLRRTTLTIILTRTKSAPPSLTTILKITRLSDPPALPLWRCPHRLTSSCCGGAAARGAGGAAAASSKRGRRSQDERWRGTEGASGRGCQTRGRGQGASGQRGQGASGRGCQTRGRNGSSGQAPGASTAPETPGPTRTPSSVCPLRVSLHERGQGRGQGVGGRATAPV